MEPTLPAQKPRGPGEHRKEMVLVGTRNEGIQLTDTQHTMRAGKLRIQELGPVKTEFGLTLMIRDSQWLTESK